MILSNDSILRLLSSHDYREFIVIYKEERSKQNKFSYAMISRKAGFASRSFPRDVAMGLKSITIYSLEAMIKGLGLRGDLAEFFRTLVYLEHLEICFPKKTPANLQRRLKNLRGRIEGKKQIIEKDPYQSEFFPLIYAACGEEKQGVKIEDIIKKTSLPKAKVEQTVTNLLTMNILKKERGKYFPTESHYFFEGMKQSRAFKNFFQYLLDCAAEEARKDFASDQKLFFTSCFSVSKDKLPSLKNDLKQVLLSYVDASEDPSGDKIASLACSLI